jgi:DNA-binding NtrC family response regulator
MARLARHDWPGNVRQLQNVVGQLVVRSRGLASLEDGPVIERLLRPATSDRWSQPDAGEVASARLFVSAGAPSMRSSAIRRAPGADEEMLPSSSGGQRVAAWRKPSDVSQDELIDALRRSRWDLKAAAELLRVSRTSLYALVEGCPQVRRAGDLDLDEIARCYEECGGDVDKMVDRLEVSKRALLRRIRELRLK